MENELPIREIVDKYYRDVPLQRRKRILMEIERRRLDFVSACGFISRMAYVRKSGFVSLDEAPDPDYKHWCHPALGRKDENLETLMNGESDGKERAKVIAPLGVLHAYLSPGYIELLHQLLSYSDKYVEIRLKQQEPALAVEEVRMGLDSLTQSIYYRDGEP